MWKKRESRGLLVLNPRFFLRTQQARGGGSPEPLLVGAHPVPAVRRLRSVTALAAPLPSSVLRAILSHASCTLLPGRPVATSTAAAAARVHHCLLMGLRRLTTGCFSLQKCLVLQSLPQILPLCPPPTGSGILPTELWNNLLSESSVPNLTPLSTPCKKKSSEKTDFLASVPWLNPHTAPVAHSVAGLRTSRADRSTHHHCSIRVF